MSAMFPSGLELARQFRITNLIRVETEEAHAHAMFHFTWAKLVQERLPVRVLFEVFRDMSGKQDVSGITTVHYPLGNVYAGTGDVGLFI